MPVFVDCLHPNTVKASTCFLWRRGVVVITTAQLYSTKPDFRFCKVPNPDCSGSEICDGENI